MESTGWADETRAAARIYSSAADHFTAPQLAFWDTWGSATVARLDLRPGTDVVDLCCGAGASAIPAAHAVGSQGRVVGVDVSQGLLDRARVRADAEGVVNLELRCADASATGFADASYDAVICVFGVFFLPDMAGFMAEMWRMVRPGGTLAVTTWGPGAWDPGTTIFWDSVRDVAPALYKGFSPWDQITRPDLLVDLFERAGITGAGAEAVPGTQPLGGAEDFWVVVMGTGLRATVDALSPDQVNRVHDEVVSRLGQLDELSIRTDVVLGSARRP